MSLKSVLCFVLCARMIEAQIDRRNNFCEVYNQVHLGQLERRDALKGFNVSIAVLPHAFDEKKGRLNQNYISIQIFDEVARRAQFSYKNNFESYNYATGNETYTDVLLRMFDHTDVAVDWWAREIERVSIGITGPKGWYDASTVIIGVHGLVKYRTFDLFSVFLPFKYDVWMMLIFTVLLSGFICHFIDYILHYGHTKDKIGDNIYKSVMAFSGNPESGPYSGPNRVILVSMSLLSIVVVAAYTANLASYLIRDFSVVIKNFQDVVDKKYRVCVVKSMPDVVEIKKNYEKGLYVDKVDELGVYQGLANNECEVALMSLEGHKSYVTKSEYNPDCNLEIVGWPVMIAEASFATKSSFKYCGSIVREVLDLYLLEMFRDNTIERLKSDYYGEDRECSGSDEVHSKNQLTLQNFGGVFLMYYLVILLACAYVLLSLKYPRTFRHKLHEISVIKKASSWIKIRTLCFFANISEERHVHEERINDSTVNCSAESSENMVTDIFPSLCKLDAKDEAMKELCVEVLKMRNLSAAQHSEAQSSINEMKEEMRKLSETIDTLKICPSSNND